MRSVSIIGCGYTGLKLAQAWRNRKIPVRGFATREASLRQIESVGAEARLLNLDQTPPLLDIDGQMVYYTVPPAPTGGRDERLERFLQHVTGTPKRIVYFSTTGVYGDHAGGRVDEDTPPAPRTERAARRLAAETALRHWADSHAVAWCILRIPGIYGPGRLPLDRLRRGEPAIDPREAMPGNRIHVDDLVTACLAAADSLQADGRIYNVTDGTQDSLTAYLERVARIAALPPPPLVTLSEARETLSPMAWSFLGESRRVENHRLIDELGVVLAYRDLDAGIRASLSQG